MEKSCSNCRHFRQYYIKRNLSYFSIALGRCERKKNDKTNFLAVCEYWEDAAVLQEERKKHAVDLLNGISKSLEELVLIFKD